MTAKKFKFVSPGIFINEIDNSQLPKVPNPVGPIVIGRARRGPAMRPVEVESFSDFVEVFGEPVAGGQGGDVWRDGNFTAPMYGPYAAQAWLKNSTPLTYVRLIGCEHTDKLAAGAAGWETRDSSGNANGLGITDADGGAYGLFLADSGSAITTALTGALAAIFYINEGSIVLSGSARDSGTVSGSAVLVQSVGSDKEFRAIIRNASGTVVKTTTFNFNRDSERYIRKVFNTNPTLTNGDITTAANKVDYWLGQTFERFIDEKLSNNAAGQVHGVIFGLKGNAATKEGSDYRMSSQAAQTGWFFSQDLQVVSGAANSYQPQSMTNLFKFHCLDTGVGTQKEIKISIQDIKVSTNPYDPYGTFTVVLRKIEDSDNAPRIVERFSECNLNPSSLDYVGRKIGDKNWSWDDTERRYREYGNHLNQSKFVRVEMNPDVDAGVTDPRLLPFGFYGPLRHLGFAVISGSNKPQTFGASLTGSDFTAAHVKGGADNIIVRPADTTVFVDVGDAAYTASFLFPEIPLRVSSSNGVLANPKEAYFGIDASITSTNTRPDPGFGEYLAPLASGYNSFSLSSGETEHAFIFTLDDLSSSANTAVYVSGSRKDGKSMTAVGAENYKSVLDLGFDRFTAPLFGGFDGLDIAEKEPFNNTDLEGGSDITNYAFNSVKRAIDSVADPEIVEANLVAMPGITNEALTSHLMTVCENRADALAIVDLKGGFIPNTENTSGDSSAANRGDVDTTISNLLARRLNTSYGCAYYPWVQVRDTINDAVLWAPPSIIGLGVMANSEAKSEIWFAPAGFNRGGLTEGSAGIPVISVREKLTSKQRDKLYEANINPIASFPSEGIVVFGQKTLQVTPSALDRINVRRLLIYLKKEISRFSTQVLFDQNVQATWDRFLGLVNPFLTSVKIRLGLEDYRVILDETTTTADLRDRNIMYAKIFLKPAKAIEFIALDFVITNSGASFED